MMAKEELAVVLTSISNKGVTLHHVLQHTLSFEFKLIDKMLFTDMR